MANSMADWIGWLSGFFLQIFEMLLNGNEMNLLNHCRRSGRLIIHRVHDGLCNICRYIHMSEIGIFTQTQCHHSVAHQRFGQNFHRQGKWTGIGLIWSSAQHLIYINITSILQFSRSAIVWSHSMWIHSTWALSTRPVVRKMQMMVTTFTLINKHFRPPT